MRRPRRSDLVDSPWGGPGLALGALLVLAAALRIVGVRYGLPFPLLNPDEQSIVPRAWAMTHGGGADPAWFDYPSLLMYALAPFQAWAEAPSYLSARVVVVALGVAGVAAAWWLGARAYGTAAGVLAAAVSAVATTHVAYSRMAVTDVPLTLGATAALALMVVGRIELAGVAVGLAASTKYPGILLLVPLAVAAWGRWSRLAVAAALAAVAFALTSPYVVLRFGDAWEDARRVQRAAQAGWLGFEHDHPTPIAFVDRLWEATGPVLVVAVAGLAVALIRRTKADLVLAAFVLVYFLNLLTVDAHFDRYILPLVPVVGALAGRLRGLAPVALVLLAVPLTWSVRETRELTKPDARVAAHRWIEANVPRRARVAVDPSFPRLAAHRVVRLALPRPGEPFDPNRDVDRLRAAGVGYIVLTGAVEDRVLDARESYPREADFVEETRREARRVYAVRAGRRFAGHWVEVFRL